MIADRLPAEPRRTLEAWQSQHSQAVLHWLPTGATWYQMLRAWMGRARVESGSARGFDPVGSLIREVRAHALSWRKHGRPLIWANTWTQDFRNGVPLRKDQREGT